MFLNLNDISTKYFKLFSLLALLFITSCASTNADKSWNDTVKRVSSGVVSIQVDVPMAFDGKWNRSTYATGFIVDAKRGIILTNRHVVTPGPVTAKAVLINNEEIDLTPLYIDPVHDFGFYRYQPEHIKHIKPHEFELSEHLPNVGQEIRIIGNDAGQKISILDGTISRIDRQAPNYGKGTYNDFNIFYIQAATASTGGSSGSPVINKQGQAVALNAGSQTKSANAFYLPLEKIKLALTKLQQNEKIIRGTVQTTFTSTPYAELKRLGLTPELEQKYRHNYPELKGLLVARAIIPQSEASKSLAVGDILLSINEEEITNFSLLESMLNDNVDKNISADILRNGQLLTVQITVDDLDTITPNSLVQFNGGIFHNLSYQQARHYNKPISGVYVASSVSNFYQAGVPNRSVITEFNGAKIKTVEDLQQQLNLVPSNSKVHLRYYDYSTPNSTNYALVEINRTWFEHSYCQRDLTLGYWPCTQIDSAATANKIAPVAMQQQKPVQVTNQIEHALVNVRFASPYSIQGRSGNNNSYGAGVIVDVEKGLVAINRNTIFSALGDIKIIFNNRLEVSGKVEYIHPLHNLALISYDTKALSNVLISQIKFSDKTNTPGDEIRQIGLNGDGAIEYRQTFIDTHEELWLRQFNVPQFIEKNIKVSYLINANNMIDGVLVNQANEVTALWTTFEQSDDSGNGISQIMAGLSIEYVKQMLDVYRAQKPLYSLDIDLTLIAPVDALQMGLSDEWLNSLQNNGSNNDKLLAIYNVVASSPSAAIFKRGDILLSINGTRVSSFQQVEQLSQAEKIKVTYFSEGKINTVDLTPTPLFGDDIQQVFYWAGLYLHAPHRAAQIQGNVSNTGVYVASYKYGSPATRYGLFAMQRIVEIDGKPITTTADFVATVKGKKHQSSVLVKTLDFNNHPRVITLRMDNHYWPFYELKYENGQWQKIDHL
ncbi:trypsin-like peptidase domain-containing protein [Thalassotalea sp. PLHSN55]|uniref:trypsin-like peptidase domain-containing protein n=1 Tax=Thalassotalea sp. PLHSN55 TaxID=3435888 RepID=UPI003F871E10